MTCFGPHSGPSSGHKMNSLRKLYQSIPNYLCFHLHTLFLPCMIPNTTGITHLKIKNSPHFMEPESSLPHSLVSATCPYPESAGSNPYPPTSHFLKIHVNISLPSTSGSPKWSLSLSFPHQNPCIPLSSPPYAPRAGQATDDNMAHAHFMLDT